MTKTKLEHNYTIMQHMNQQLHYTNGEGEESQLACKGKTQRMNSYRNLLTNLGYIVHEHAFNLAKGKREEDRVERRGICT
jgi:hypothetical protein